MELKYIWVEKYKIIENLGVNLSNQGDFNFEFKNSKLILIKKDRNILDFGKNVTSVNAIVGQNGSGKSTLCEIILNTVATLTSGGYSHQLIFKGVVCYGNYIFYHTSLKIKNKEELIGNGFKVLKFKESPLDQFMPDGRTNFETGFIYYSDSLFSQQNLNLINLSNISTKNLLEFDAISSNHFPSTGRFGMKLSRDNGSHDYVSHLTAHETEESNRIAELIINSPKFIPFSLPKYFHLSMTYSGSNSNLYMDSDFDYKDRSFFDNLETRIFEMIYSNINSSNEDIFEVSAEILKKSIIALYKSNFIRSIVVEKGKYHKRKTIAEKISEKFDFRNEFEEEEIERFVFGLDDNTLLKMKIPRASDLFKLLVLIIDNVKIGARKFNATELSENRNLLKDWRFLILSSIHVKNTRKNSYYLRRFIDKEKEFFINLDSKYTTIRLINFSAENKFSAGEYSFLSLFSRIYAAVKSYLGGLFGYYEKESFILFIDEGELNFHPEWKRKYLSWILDFLNSNLIDRKFQIILTSHSPYLLSDLNEDNIISLKKSSDQKTEIIKDSNRKTFAANIYELLADSFFLEDGFIGEFAQKQLESLISFLQSDMAENERWDQQKSVAFINSIGDDLIKMRLEDFYKEKYDIPLKSLEDERNELEKRINEINKYLSDDQN